MKVRKEIEALAPKMREWQEHLHKHPEVALEEVNSAKYIASELRAMGYEVEEGIGTTGLVATLKVGNGSKNLDRMRMRTPTTQNLAGMVKALEGSDLADVPNIILTIDPCISCSER